ncbi:MAG: phosphatase PAP2 family protein [Solirubrobacterales bacterium]
MKYRSFWTPLDRAETPALEWVVRVRRGGWIERATRVITETGQYGLVWYLIAAVAAARDEKNRDRWISAAVKVLAIYLINTGIKLVARRRRPELASIGTPTGLSFPSAHAATSFAAAQLYGDIVPVARPVLLAGAAGMTSTRLHFCVHYPSDLVAGALLGTILARLAR